MVFDRPTRHLPPHSTWPCHGNILARFIIFLGFFCLFSLPASFHPVFLDIEPQSDDDSLQQYGAMQAKYLENTQGIYSGWILLLLTEVSPYDGKESTNSHKSFSRKRIWMRNSTLFRHIQRMPRACYLPWYTPWASKRRTMITHWTRTSTKNTSWSRSEALLNSFNRPWISKCGDLECYLISWVLTVSNPHFRNYVHRRICPARDDLQISAPGSYTDAHWRVLCVPE